jgi:biotin transport system substrate-specific component
MFSISQFVMPSNVLLRPLCAFFWPSLVLHVFIDLSSNQNTIFKVESAEKGGIVISVNTYERLRAIRLSFYEWLQSTSWVTRLLLCFGVAIITGVAAQLRIPLPFTPVPVTAQVFVVLLTGVLLGSYYGGLSMLFYLLFGFAGVPWFTNAATGLPIGPTTGYIIGFIPAAMFIGHMITHYRTAKRFFALISIMIGAVGIIYLCGALNFFLFMGVNIKQTMIMAVLPFVPFDIVKAIIAATCARALLPQDT